MKMETWKPVVGYEGLYEVSDEGRVRSLNYGRTRKVKVLKPSINSKGYLYLGLCKKGEKKKNFLVHRLEVSAFRGPIPPGMTVDHINGNKFDNRLENLQLLSREDNVRKSNNKQIDLMEADWPYRELTFPSSYEASEFFNYKARLTVTNLIFKARKRGENFINIRRKKYFFSQAD